MANHPLIKDVEKWIVDSFSFMDGIGYDVEFDDDEIKNTNIIVADIDGLTDSDFEKGKKNLLKSISNKIKAEFPYLWIHSDNDGYYLIMYVVLADNDRFFKIKNIPYINLNESKKSLKESYPNYDVDDVYKELKRLCDKGENVFSEFYVERGKNGFVVSISDDSSYIKLKDFIPYNIHYNENSFYMYYKNDSTYMTIFANYEDENAINVLVEVVRSLANLKGAYDKCETVSTEIVNQVSNLY